MLQRLRGALGSDGVVVLEEGDGTRAARAVADLVQALAAAGVDVSADVQVRGSGALAVASVWDGEERKGPGAGGGGRRRVG